VLAALAVASLIAAEVLPWTTLALPSSASGADPTSPVGAVSYTINRLDSLGTLTYHLGWFALLGLIGAVLTGGRTPRRGVFGAAIGVAAAQVVVVIGIVSSVRDRFTNTSTGLALPDSITSSVDSGAFLAFAAIALALAAIVVTALPAPVRARLTQTGGEPVDAQFTDAPPDLTVAPAAPIDESYFARPEGRSDFRTE
jgi:hypothetical protein